MSIIEINTIIKIKVENKAIAKIIQQSIDPDNLTNPPMIVNSTDIADQIIITIKKSKRIETVLSTLQDLLSAFDSAESILINSKICKSTLNRS